MAETLGILVTTDKHLDSVIELVNAAHAKGKETQVFFTGAAVHLTLQPNFAQLAGKAKLWICDVSFRANGYHGREEEVPGVDFKSFATQGRNAEMLAESDRYVVF
jgi:peroxiredoxin family protein